MPDESACERRIYRLAVLLTGNSMAATNVITEVLRSQPDLRRMDNAHMDRLTILRSREATARLLPSPPLSPDSSGAIGSLIPQQREAWILHVLYGIGPREAARAMDCSVSATERHIEMARAAMREQCDEIEIRRDLLAYSLALDVPEFYRSRKIRKRRWRMIRRISLAVLAGAAAAAVVFIMLRLTIWSAPSAQ